MPRKRQESGVVSALLLAFFALTLLSPPVMLVGVFAVKLAWGWLTRTSSPDPPLQCVYDQRDQPGCVGRQPEQAPTDQEPSR